MVTSITINGVELACRETDRYVPATPLCKAAGKKWGDYFRLDSTKLFIQTLAESTGIPAESLVQMKSGRSGGTWIHPLIVIDFAQWVSPEFRGMVVGWAARLLDGETVTLTDAERVAGLKTAKARVTAAGGIDPAPVVTRELVEALHAMLNDQRAANARLDGRVGCLEERILGLSAAQIRAISAERTETVQDRLMRRYPDWKTTPGQRATIRKETNNKIRRYLPKHPIQYFGGECEYTPDQTPILDDEMDRVYQRATRKGQVETMGLFAEAA